MSAENIFSNYPPDQDFSVTLRSEAKAQGYDPVVYLGIELTKTGREELLQKCGSFEEELDHDPRDVVEALVQEATEDEHTAIFFGHLIEGLGKSLETRKFDLGALIGKFNLSISGTLLPELELPEDYNDVIDIEHDELIGMRSVYSGDKTFTKFFRRPEYLPRELERFLRKEFRIFESASFKKILPLWEQRAKLLISTVYTTAVQKVEENKDDDPLAGFTAAQRASFMEMARKFQDKDNYK